MPTIVILAHGALGAFDEVIFVSVAVVFIGMMAFSWFRSQQMTDELLDEDSKPKRDTVQSNSDNTDRFELE